MTYSMNWYIENEIIYIHFSGKTTADELRASLMAVHEMIASSPRHLVHILNDVSTVTHPVSPKESLKIIREIGSPERLGWAIVLGEKSLIVKIGVALGTSIFKSRNRTFDTLAEAETFLKGADPLLSWDKVDTSIIEA